MIKIVEVGPRDGLQNEKTILTTEDKFKFISLLSLSGLKNIEVTSFVKATAIPQMGDANELFKMVQSQLDFGRLNFPCLVPNIHGYETAKKLGVKEIALFSATSDSFTKKMLMPRLKKPLIVCKKSRKKLVKTELRSVVMFQQLLDVLMRERWMLLNL